MDIVLPEGIREYVSENWTNAIREFWCVYCGKPLKTGEYPMKNSSSGNSVYAFLPICYCHAGGLDGHELFFRIIKHRNGNPERYQLGFFFEPSHNKTWADYLEKDSDEAVVPIRDFWESCYLLPDGNLLVPATDDNLFVMILRLDSKFNSFTKRYYDEKYEVKVRQNSFQSPIVVTGDGVDAEFDFKVRELDDKNVAMSKDGLVIKCNDKWLAYSKTHSTFFTIEEKRIVECPLYIVPTFDVRVGDLVCDSGRYYFVTFANYNVVLGRDDMPAFRVDDHRISPECKILGANVYYKVLAATDAVINAKGNISGMPSDEAILGDAAMAKIFMLSSMMQNGGKPEMQNLLVPLAFTTNKNADAAVRNVMFYAMLNGMFGSE